MTVDARIKEIEDLVRNNLLAMKLHCKHCIEHQNIIWNKLEEQINDLRTVCGEGQSVTGSKPVLSDELVEDEEPE